MRRCLSLEATAHFCLYLCFLYQCTGGEISLPAWRIAFRIAITDTPTSAKTAAHILAQPVALKSRTKELYAPRRKNNIFICNADRLSGNPHNSEIFRVRPSSEPHPAASIAASGRGHPIAIPTSARASTGASLIPSPTNTELSFFAGLFQHCFRGQLYLPGNNSVYA